MKAPDFRRLLTAALFVTSPLYSADAMKSQLYADLVAPILTAKCAGCHGEDKQKGKLRVDSLEAILKGGGEGVAVVAGKVDESPLLTRVYLPLDDDEHMPPEDKDQLTAEETAVLAFWVTSGAKGTGTLAELKPDPKTAAAAAHVIGNLPKASDALTKAKAPKADPAMVKLVAETIGQIEKTGASLMAIAQDTPELRFSALNVSKDFSDGSLAALKPVATQIKWVDLARTKVTDKGLAHLVGMVNLTRLHLENTGITDAGLDVIKGLTNLEYLNLYGTPITDAGLAKLAGMKNLKKLFIWQTKATDAGAAKLLAAIPGIDINTGWKAPLVEVAALVTKTPAAPTVPAKPVAAPAKPVPVPAKPVPVPAKPVPVPVPAKPAPAPVPAAAVDPMFQKAVSEVQSAANEAAKRATQAKADFDAAIKVVADATKKAEALKISSDKAVIVAAETKAALDQLKKAVEASKK